jgi:hypothetical protein
MKRREIPAWARCGVSRRAVPGLSAPEFTGERCGSGNFVEFSGGDVEDEAAYLVGVRDEGVGFDPLN